MHCMRFALRLYISTDAANTTQLTVLIDSVSMMKYMKSRILVRVIEIAPHMKLIHYITCRQAPAANNLKREVYKV